MIVNASLALANGLRTEFVDTYLKTLNRVADSRLSLIMDGIGATNRQHEFAYPNAAPHMEYWPRGAPIPTGAFDYTKFTAVVHEFAERVEWLKWDRKDDQTDSLMQMAAATGESAGLIPERIAFDLLTGSTSALPAIPLAPDGIALAGVDGASTRFGISGGNLITGSGVTTITSLQTDYYTAITRFMRFQDGRGQPLLSPSAIAGGVVIIAGAANQKIFEEAFLQKIQGMGIIASGAYGTASGTAIGAAGVTNLVQDTSRNIQLWTTPRITDNDWWVALLNPPKKPLFTLDREGLREFTSLEDDNNSDHTRSTAKEYVQWELRQGGGIALPYGICKVNN